MSIVSLQFVQHLYSLQIRDTVRLPKQRILTIVFGADTSILLPFGGAEGGSPSQKLSGVRDVPAESLFRNGGDALELIDGAVPEERLNGSHDWSIGHCEGERPVQLLFAGSRKQQNSNMQALKVLHTYIYADATALVQSFIQANPARFRVEFGIDCSHTLPA